MEKIVLKSVPVFCILIPKKLNYEWLKTTRIPKRNVDTCLHIVASDSEQLKETYNYILSNYGIDLLTQQTSVLSKSTGRIKLFEKFLSDVLDEKMLVSAIRSDTDLNDIMCLLKTCKELNLDIVGSIFLSNAQEVKKIVEVCKKHNLVNLSGNMFYKTAEEIEKVVCVCNKYDLDKPRV